MHTPTTTQLTFNQHSIDISVDNQQIFYRYMSQSTLGWLSTDRLSKVDQVLIEYRSNINWDVDQVPIEILIESIDTHSPVDAFSTHDPENVHQDKECLGLG